MPQRRWIEYVGTLTNNTFTLPANPSRRAVIISNNSDAEMTYRVGGGEASADAGVVLETASAIALDGDLLPEGAISLFCAGTSKAYTVYEVVG